MSAFLPLSDDNEIKLVDLAYYIGAYPLFQQLNVSFLIGQITAITGPNASGKSTLLKILAGTCQPHHGKILFQQKNIEASTHYKQQLGYVPPVPALYPHLTVGENLRLVATLKNMPSKKINAFLTTTLAQCNLMTYEKVHFSKLSEGLKRRVVLASQLVHQPSILILDEPCAELDPFQRQQLWQLLAQLRHPKRWIIFSSHHPQEIGDLCDKMYFMHQGSLQVLSQTDPASQTLWQTAFAPCPVPVPGKQPA